MPALQAWHSSHQVPPIPRTCQLWERSKAPPEPFPSPGRRGWGGCWGGAEHAETPHSFLGDARESLAANSQNATWHHHHCGSHRAAPGGPRHPGSRRLFSFPKPSTSKVQTHPDPCTPGTLLGARAEVTIGHRSCLSSRRSQPVPTAPPAAALPRSLATLTARGTPGPPGTTTTRYGTPGCSATPAPSPSPAPAHAQHPHQPCPQGTFGTGLQQAQASVPALAWLMRAQEIQVPENFPNAWGHLSRFTS